MNNGFIKKGRKVAAATVGVALAGTAAWAGFTWYQSQGTGTATELNVTLPLTAVTEHATSATLDAGPTGGPTTYDMAQMNEGVTSVQDGSFWVSMQNQYTGNTHVVMLAYTNSTAQNMKVTGVNMTDAAGLPFAGVAPFDHHVVRSLTTQGNAELGQTRWDNSPAGNNPALCSTNTLAPGDTLTLAVRLGRTASTLAPFLLNVEFAPALAAVPTTEATCPTVPFTEADLALS